MKEQGKTEKKVERFTILAAGILLLAVLAGVLVFGTSCGGGNQTNSGEELSDKLDEVDEEYIIDAGSGERLELKDPEW